MKIDYKTQCELYRPNGGCYYTFDGSCQKEKCFTYRLLQNIQEIEENYQLKKENEELKEINSQLMEYRKHSTTCQECYMDGLEDGKLYNKELHKHKQALKEIKEIADETLWNYPSLDDVRVYQNLEKISRITEDFVDEEDEDD